MYGSHDLAWDAHYATDLFHKIRSAGCDNCGCNSFISVCSALPGCTDRCGNLTIPYPFGIGDGCYLRAEFNITCDQSTTPPSANLINNGVCVTDISIAEGELRIMQDIVMDCYDAQGYGTHYNRPLLQLPPPFTISDDKNKFFNVGCGSLALFTGELANPGPDEEYYTVKGFSMTLCEDVLGDALTNSCSGFGCTQMSIPSPASGLRSFSVALDTFVDNRTGAWYTSYPCSYAFIVELAMFAFSANTSFDLLNKTSQLPAVVNWATGDEPCDANNQNYLCKATNAECINRTIRNDVSGYIC